MTGTLLLTAALMGAAATPHCAAMCAGACKLAAQRCTGDDRSTGRWSVMLGRLGGYALAGAAAATIGSSVTWLAEFQPWAKPIWLMLQLAVLLLGLNLLVRGRLPLAVEAWLANGGRRKQPASSIQPVHWHGNAKAAATGALWFAVPCGVLHAAVVIAALASDPIEGAAVMALFGLTSTPGLLAGHWLWRKAWRTDPNISRLASVANAPGVTNNSVASTWSLRLAGAGIVAMSAWTVGMAVWAPLQAAWCA
jgi:sulfite exporter TauE/SafE